MAEPDGGAQPPEEPAVSAARAAPSDAAPPETAAAAAGAARPDAAESPAPPAGAAPPDDTMRRGYARSRERAEATRAGLEPLAPGERPLGLQLAASLAAFIALANLVAVIAGAGSESPRLGLAFALLMAGAAYGLWNARYLVLVAFEALLGVSIVYATLSLAFASNALAVVLGVSVLAICGPVFWLLIRVMARLQVPPQ